MFLENKIPFQFGDPTNGDYIVFPCEDLSFVYTPKINTERVDSALFDGSARLNGNEKNRLGDIVIKLSFGLDTKSKYSQDYILKLCNSTPKKLFVYEQGFGDDESVKKVLWQYAEIVGAIDVVSGSNETSQGYKKYTVTLLLQEPEFYECDEGLKFFVANQINPKWDGTYKYNGAIKWGEYMNATLPLFNTLTTKQQYFYLKGDLPISITDRFYAIESYQLPTNSYKSLTLTNNNVTQSTTSGLKLDTSKTTHIYLIRINALEKGESVSIKNTTNNSDIMITWLFDLANQNDLLFNSVDNILFDPSAQTLIDQTFYSIDSEDLLHFSAYLDNDINQFIPKKIKNDTLVFQKSTATNNTIQIATLKPYL